MSPLVIRHSRRCTSHWLRLAVLLTLSVPFCFGSRTSSVSFPLLFLVFYLFYYIFFSILCLFLNIVFFLILSDYSRWPSNPVVATVACCLRCLRLVCPYSLGSECLQSHILSKSISAGCLSGHHPQALLARFKHPSRWDGTASVKLPQWTTVGRTPAGD